MLQNIQHLKMQQIYHLLCMQLDTVIHILHKHVPLTFTELRGVANWFFFLPRGSIRIYYLQGAHDKWKRLKIKLLGNNPIEPINRDCLKICRNLDHILIQSHNILIFGRIDPAIPIIQLHHFRTLFLCASIYREALY